MDLQSTDKKPHAPTIDGGLSGQDDHDELQADVGHLEVLEHGLHAVRPLGVLAEAGLALDGHPRILGDLPQLVREAPVRGEDGQSACLVYREGLLNQ